MTPPRQWHKAFKKLPAAWRGLSYFKRSIMQDLWRSSDADCSGRIEVDGDPAQFLVRELDIVARRDRANAVTAVRELINEDGLITIDGTVATVRTERSMSDGRSMDVRKTLDRSPRSADLCAPIEHRTQPNSAESLIGAEQIDRENRESRESARDGDFRRPVGEPPPGFVDTFQEPAPKPVELTLEEKILTAWQRAVLDRTTKKPPSSKLAADGAAEVAKWLRENISDNETPLSAFQRALKLYVAEDKKSLVEAAWPLKWLPERLVGYLGAKQPEKRTIQNPAHAVWKAPDYEAEMRESYDPDRIKREREEWFATCPEAREDWEQAELEREALPPPTRVVVSIAEAKPQVKPGYRTKTPEEIAARKALLEEQARALRAASSAE